jgi:hypothetical protein
MWRDAIARRFVRALSRDRSSRQFPGLSHDHLHFPRLLDRLEGNVLVNVRSALRACDARLNHQRWQAFVDHENCGKASLTNLEKISSNARCLTYCLRQSEIATSRETRLAMVPGTASRKLICPTGKSRHAPRDRLSFVQSSNEKHFAFPEEQISCMVRPVPPPQEGRIAIVTDVGSGMRWPCWVARRATAARTAKSRGPVPPTLGSSYAKRFAQRRWLSSPDTGESAP